MLLWRVRDRRNPYCAVLQFVNAILDFIRIVHARDVQHAVLQLLLASQTFLVRGPILQKPCSGKTREICMYPNSRPTISGLPLVREKSGKFKVREKSGNFVIGQGNLEF